MKFKKYVIIILSTIMIFSPRAVYAIKSATDMQLDTIERSLAENALSRNPERFTDGHLKLMRMVQKNLKNIDALYRIYYSLLSYNLIMGIYVAKYEHWPWDLCNMMIWLHEDGIRNEELGKDKCNDALHHEWWRICYEFQEWSKALEESPSEEFVRVFLEILYEIYKTSHSMCSSKPLNFKCIEQICTTLSQRWNLNCDFPELKHCSYRCICCIM